MFEENLGSLFLKFLVLKQETFCHDKGCKASSAQKNFHKNLLLVKCCNQLYQTSGFCLGLNLSRFNLRMTTTFIHSVLL